MNDRSIGAAALVAALLIATSALAPFVGVAGAVPDARVAVTDATVAPATPTAGAPITVDVTVRLSAGSDSAADLDRVAVRDANGTVLGVATGLGTLSPGETLTVPVTFTVDDPGAYDLSVVATVSDSDDETATASRPLSLVVERGAPLVEIAAPAAVAGDDSAVEVTVSNPTAAALRDLAVTVVSPPDGERLRRAVATLPAGASRTLNFSVVPAAPGERTIRVRVDYTTVAGTRATVAQERGVTVDPLTADVGVRVAAASADGAGDAATAGGGAAGLAGLIGVGGGGALQQSTGGSGGDASGDRLAVTVTNFGNAAIERVVLVPRGDDGTTVSAIGRVAVADALAPGEAATVTVDLSDVETAGEVAFVARYDLGDERRSAVAGYEFRPKRGAVELTGLNVSIADDGYVTIDGNLGNVGGGEVSGVVVGVAAAEVAAPAYPQRSYFVGTVGASEFAPFSVTGRVDAANATAIPVRVAYTTGDDRVTEVIEVPLPADQPSASGPLGALAAIDPVGGLLLAVGFAVPIAVAVAVRRYV
ncbi:CARDB domain-containing protein [Halobaculum gomorrense]|uniref:CARDB domain-containing protein n=1 Tax=Halobaculum gomorrense TaxID=43928 RepID=UPI0009340182|nr:CARDB domain-containing protein [Halobaculum gomorrense]